MTEENAIKTYVVSGFLEAGKTTYIQETFKYDYFYKRVKTLILSFEEGEEEWNQEFLLSRNTYVEIYEGGEDITAFCIRCIEKHNPGRIYIEDNVMLGDVLAKLPERMQVVDKTVIIAGSTLKAYWHNMKSLFQQLLKGAGLVIFNRVTEDTELGTYGTTFRLMNKDANYLVQQPLGYHEKAFGNRLVYSIDGEKIAVEAKDYPSFFLDSVEYPEHYEGKIIELTSTNDTPEDYPEGYIRVGQPVMVCCAADMQFFGIPVRLSSQIKPNRGERISIKARATLRDPNFFGRVVLYCD